MADLGLLDSLIYGYRIIRSVGVSIIQRSILNFSSQFVVSDNPSTGATDVALAGDLGASGPAGGDLGGSYPNPSVQKVNGAAYPTAGAFVAGTIPRATGGSVVAMGALDLANTNAVTGVLPAANLAAATTGAKGAVQLAGDLAGTAAAPTIKSITLGSDARGDIYQRGASVLQRLPAGTAGQVLTSGGPGADNAWSTVAATNAPRIDVTLDCTSVTLNLKTAGEVNQLVNLSKSGPAIPSGISSGVTVKPENSAGGYSGVLSFGAAGMRNQVTAVGNVYIHMGLSQFGIDRTKPFDLWLLLNASNNSVGVNDFNFSGVQIYSPTAGSFMIYRHLTRQSGATYSDIYGSYNGTSVSTLGSRRVDTNLTHLVQVVRFYPLEAYAFSTADVSGAFPSPTPSDSLVGFNRRGMVTLQSGVNSTTTLNKQFPADDDELIFGSSAGTSGTVDFAYKQIRILQRY